MSTARQQVMADAAACDQLVRCYACSSREGRDVLLPAWKFSDKALAKGQLRCIACNRASTNAAYAKRKSERELLRLANTALMRPDKFYRGPTGPVLARIDCIHEPF